MSCQPNAINERENVTRFVNGSKNWKYFLSLAYSSQMYDPATKLTISPSEDKETSIFCKKGFSTRTCEPLMFTHLVKTN